MDVSACERWATLRCRAAQRFCRRCRVRDRGAVTSLCWRGMRTVRTRPTKAMTSVMVRAKSRRDILTAAECASPLAGRVYDLRHACVSTWLNGGIPPAQVAEWAGHSVAIPLKIYAKCLDGQDAIAKRRIEEALGDPGEDEQRRPRTPATAGLRIWARIRRRQP